MSGENTENPQDSGEDATTDVPVSGGDAVAPPPVSPVAPGVEPFAVPPPETVEIPDPTAAINNFEIPPPPTFSASPPKPSPEPVIPPPPTDGVSAAPTLRKQQAWSPDSTWSSASAHKRESVPATVAQAAATRAMEARDDALEQPDFVHPAPGHEAENSYRGWTIAIFAGLAVLLIGAIIWMAYLFNNAPLSLPGSDEGPVRDPAPIVSATADPAETAVDEPAASTTTTPTDRCGELCAEVATLVGDEITGADGADTWLLSGAWETADSAVLPAVETVQAAYQSTAGELAFTIWGFEDDAAADDAYATLVDAQGEPDFTDSVYNDGTGTRNDFNDGSASSILWSITGDETQPWVLQVEGSDADAVKQFYLALPI